MNPPYLLAKWTDEQNPRYCISIYVLTATHLPHNGSEVGRNIAATEHGTEMYRRMPAYMRFEVLDLHLK